jgi:hypothetical protein
MNTQCFEKEQIMYSKKRRRPTAICGWLSASVMGGTILLSGCDPRPAANPTANSLANPSSNSQESSTANSQANYRVVRADAEQLTVTSDNGDLKRSFKLDTGTTVTVDGEPASVVQLAVGDAVAVTTKSLSGEEVATEIRAVSRERLEGGDVAPTLPADIPPGQARDTSLHGLDLPADTTTLTNPDGIDAPSSTPETNVVPPEASVDER